VEAWRDVWMGAPPAMFEEKRERGVREGRRLEGGR